MQGGCCLTLAAAAEAAVVTELLHQRQSGLMVTWCDVGLSSLPPHLSDPALQIQLWASQVTPGTIKADIGSIS